MVEVTLIDDVSGETMGVTQLSAEDLPESFDPNTTLHLGQEDWSVVDAKPTTRAQCAESGALVLRLRRIEKIDPGNVVYSLPSICDWIPPLSEEPLTGEEFLLADDDWRQFEFVSQELAEEVDEEIEKIRWIHENAAGQVGWRKIHLRKKPQPPLVREKALTDLATALRVATPSGVTYRGAQARIVDGYSITSDGGFTVYGVAPEGNVQVMALGQYSKLSPDAESVARLKALAHDWSLDLVYWCRCARVGPGDPWFEALLLGENRE